MSPEQWLKVVRRYEDVLPTSLIVIPASARQGTIGEAAKALQEAAPVERIEIPKSN
jgi:hypothetical protein